MTKSARGAQSCTEDVDIKHMYSRNVRKWGKQKWCKVEGAIQEHD